MHKSTSLFHFCFFLLYNTLFRSYFHSPKTTCYSHKEHKKGSFSHHRKNFLLLFSFISNLQFVGHNRVLNN